jgi:hypothetical protein
MVKKGKTPVLTRPCAVDGALVPYGRNSAPPRKGIIIFNLKMWSRFTAAYIRDVLFATGKIHLILFLEHPEINSRW